LIPVKTLEAVVAPVIVHVNVLTEQLSLIVGFVVVYEILQLEDDVFVATFAGQAITGLILSEIVTVKLHVAVLPAASRAV
jgi:hypothetical protein